MLNLTSRQQIAIGLALTVLMLLTRSHHWASIHSLPDASWAIFFQLGVYVRPLWVVPALIAASVGIDYAAITWGGVSDFCVSPAYWMLIPAYLVLFAGGRFYVRRHSLSLLGLFRLVSVALAVVVVESGARGGSMTTVEEAADRGVTVLAVPGSVLAEQSVGTNQLIFEGTPVARDVADVLAALGVHVPAGTPRLFDPAAPAAAPHAGPGGAVASVLSAVPASVEQIAAAADVSVTDAVTALARLEATGAVRRVPGGYEQVAVP